MDSSKTVWCGNLSEKVTEEVLYELFLQAAPLESVKIPKDRDGRQSNFGFVTFKHEISVEYALKLLNGTRLYDKIISVKPRNSSSGGGGGGQNPQYHHQQPKNDHRKQQQQQHDNWRGNASSYSRQSSHGGNRNDYGQHQQRRKPYDRRGDDRNRRNYY